MINEIKEKRSWINIWINFKKLEELNAIKKAMQDMKQELSKDI
jgi:hypothetical protein